MQSIGHAIFTLSRVRQLKAVISLTLALGIGGNIAFRVTEEAQAQSIVPAASPTGSSVSRRETQQTILSEGWRITSTEAMKLESQLAADPDNLPLRIRLLSYYTQYMIPEPRTTHLLWLIEHHPDADIFRLGSVLTSAVPDWTGLNPPVKSERARTLWLQQVERFPLDTKVLSNAALALAHDSPWVSVDLVRRARDVEPDNAEWVNWLGLLYARAIRASLAGGPQKIRAFTRSSQDRDPWPTFSLPLAESKSLKSELETSKDVALMTAAANALVTETSLLIGRRTDEEPSASGAFGTWLLNRARELDSEGPR